MRDAIILGIHSPPNFFSSSSSVIWRRRASFSSLSFGRARGAGGTTVTRSRPCSDIDRCTTMSSQVALVTRLVCTGVVESTVGTIDSTDTESYLVITVFEAVGTLWHARTNAWLPCGVQCENTAAYPFDPHRFVYHCLQCAKCTRLKKLGARDRSNPRLLAVLASISQASGARFRGGGLDMMGRPHSHQVLFVFEQCEHCLP